jgi:hypothetical protein
MTLQNIEALTFSDESYSYRIMFKEKKKKSTKPIPMFLERK